MIGPLKAVSAAIRKLRRKKRLSTELHSRWGDVSITYPNDGSWSQWDQPSGFAVNTEDDRPEEIQSQKHASSDSHCTPSRLPGSLRESASGDEASGTIPTRHYDAGLRGRSRTKHRQPSINLGIRDSGDGTAWWDTGTVDRSDSEDENPTLSPRGRRPPENTRTRTDEAGSPQRAPKSPPLSVTSRMRHSQHSSTATDPTGSMPGTASSQTTSFAASSASGTDDPRLGYNAAYQEKKQQLRAKYHEDPALKQELVPSYDELYG